MKITKVLNMIKVQCKSALQNSIHYKIASYALPKSMQLKNKCFNVSSSPRPNIHNIVHAFKIKVHYKISFTKKLHFMLYQKTCN